MILHRPRLGSVVPLLLTAIVVTPFGWSQRARRRPRVPASVPAPSMEGCQGALRSTLDGLRPALGACMMQAQGFERGQVRVRVTVDAQGTLIGLEAMAHVNGAPDDAAGRCVEAVVRAVRFTGCPESPMSEVEKVWSFAAPPR